MSLFIYYFKLYFLIISQDIKTRMQYRIDFYISTFSIILVNMLGYMSFWVLFKSINNIKGWSYYEILFLFSFSILSITPAQLFFENMWNLERSLLDGSFIKYYFKPINTLFYYVSEIFDLKGIGQLAFGIVTFIYSSVKLNISWGFFKLFLLMITLFSSSLIMISFLVISSSLGFWIIFSGNTLVSFFFRLGEFAKYPLSIFPRFFKYLFTFVIPIGFISYYPAGMFLERRNPDPFIWISPFIGFVFFLIAYKVWKTGINSYSGTGS